MKVKVIKKGSTPTHTFKKAGEIVEMQSHIAANAVKAGLVEIVETKK